MPARMRAKESAIAPDFADRATRLPLCVDLDGTLIRSDTLIDSLTSGAGNWRVWSALLTLLSKGRAAMKREVAQVEPIDATSLPYNDELLQYLRAEKAQGRKLILVTAADQTTADAVATHLQIFDEVMASDGVHNLKGAHKAAALVERFGEGGFVYAGNDRSDLEVWRKAAAAIVVNATKSLAEKAANATSIEKSFSDMPLAAAAALLRALRPHQWVKNLLVLVPVATSHSLKEASAWMSAGWIFADLKADRLHPHKRRRPFASGALSLPMGLAMSATLLTAGAFFAAQTGTIALVALYAAVSLSYSLWFKEFPLVDIFVLAGLYTLRLFAGGEATGHQVSLWLLGFSSFFFLSLALVKRVSELMTLTGRNVIRRGYTPVDVPMLQLMGVASGFTSVVILSLFVQDEATTQLYASPAILWCTVPLILFWLCRIWLSTVRGYMHDDPIVYAAKDWVSWLVTLAVFGALAAAKVANFAAGALQ